MRDQWLNETCRFNEKFIDGEIRAVVLIFHGLGARFSEEYSSIELALAEENILTVYPYYGPWSWMNRQSRKMVDEIVERLFAELDRNLPLIASGGSMGGASALLYCRYGKRVPVACELLFPVCDVEMHFGERPDLPPTFRQAFYGYPEPFDEVLREHSPLHQVEFMPDIPYQIIHGDADTRVSKKLHSDRMVAALRQCGRKVDYLEVPHLGHGINVPLSVDMARLVFILNAVR